MLEFLKPKAEERYSKLEAYCDLLSKASSGAYQSPGTDGALQLLPGQFVATISELARQWQWQRATVRQFISGLTKLGQLSVEPYSKSFIFSVNLEQRLSLLIESPDDILDFCAMQFIRFIKGRSTAKEVAAVKTAAARTALLRAALGSVADRAIIPMYDWLGLGAEAHLNTPGKLGGNWAWRAKAGFDSKALAAQIEAECAVYCRCNADVQNVKESAI